MPPHKDIKTFLDRFFATLTSDKTREAYSFDLVAYARFAFPKLPYNEGGYEKNIMACVKAIETLFYGTNGPWDEGDIAAQAAMYKKYLTSYRDPLNPNKGFSSATINRRLVFLQSLFRVAKEWHVVGVSPKLPSAKKETVTDTAGPGTEALLEMVAYLERGLERGPGTPQAIRDLCILRLMMDLGLRRGEVGALNVGSLDLLKGVVLIRAKGRQDLVEVPLSKGSVKACAAWLDTHERLVYTSDRDPNHDRDPQCDPHHPLFIPLSGPKAHTGRLTTNSIYRMIVGLGKKVGSTKRVKPHGIRHTAITDFAKQSRDLAATREFARQKDYRTTEKYIDDVKDRGKAAVFELEKFRESEQRRAKAEQAKDEQEGKNERLRPRATEVDTEGEGVILRPDHFRHHKGPGDGNRPTAS